MRVLLSTTANDGHYGPLVTLAKACAASGDEVRVAAPASYAAAVERTGFGHLPFADAPAELVGPVMARLPSLSMDEANATVMGEVFGRIDAQAALPGLVAAIDAWRPDVLVREPAELGSLAAAVHAGVPHLQVAIGMTEMTRLLADLTSAPLTELARLVGLSGDALTAAQAAEQVLSPVPAVLDRAGDPERGADTTFRYREGPSAEPAAPLPSWGNADLPLVYVTFGSVTGVLPPFAGVFRQALDGLAELPARVFLTTGRRVDLATLGTLPANAHVEVWWPQAAVLAQAAVLLGHGGFGTTMGAIAAGVPQVVAPIFTSDQVINARHVAAVGAGIAAAPGPDVVPDACRQLPHVLADPAFLVAAESVAAEIAELPPASAAVAVVRRIAG